MVGLTREGAGSRYSTNGRPVARDLRPPENTHLAALLPEVERLQTRYCLHGIDKRGRGKFGRYGRMILRTMVSGSSTGWWPQELLDEH